ncbi:molybdate ABC transporter substrate-binding protein [Teichococcus rhizosphaerae]|uniref:molybdate ABC transporter substrate-binding protein n=1 Tax=Teichococcus rhizosphaerae TaxID=1335062 RepID=UPI001FE5C856|nr:molybdate ABC transporter substrate-binding protein [Pseudoroseomonas rhizosphaerae]
MLLALALPLALPTGAAHAAGPPVRLAAAGSLRAALEEVGAAFTAATGLPVAGRYGPSGLLRERIAAGEAADVFASANMAHPRDLAGAGGRSVVLFARNRLCALAAPGEPATTETLLERMLDPAVRLGTSTPGADPSGDYAFAAFARAEALRPGARAALEAKALALTGGPGSAPPPAGQSAYAWHLAEGRAQIFLTYCSNAGPAAAALPGARVVALPEALAVGADYGLAVLSDRPEAARLALFILSPEGQAILARHGFGAPLLPGG